MQRQKGGEAPSCIDNGEPAFFHPMALSSPRASKSFSSRQGKTEYVRSCGRFLWAQPAVGTSAPPSLTGRFQSTRSIYFKGGKEQ